MLSSPRRTGFRSLIAAMAVTLASAAQSAASDFGANARRFFRNDGFTEPTLPAPRYRKHKPVSGFAAVKRAAAKRRGVLRNRRAHR